METVSPHSLSQEVGIVNCSHQKVLKYHFNILVPIINLAAIQLYVFQSL